MIIGTLSSSETSVLTRATRHNIPEDINFKSYNIFKDVFTPVQNPRRISQEIRLLLLTGIVRRVLGRLARGIVAEPNHPISCNNNGMKKVDRLSCFAVCASICPAENKRPIKSDRRYKETLLQNNILFSCK
jgi:hypothetical protein